MSNRYRDASLSPEERTEDLLAQMTLDEKLAQLQCHFFAHGDLQKDTRYGIGQVSTLEFRQALSLKEASGIQREIQETVMKNSRFGIPAVFHMEGLCGAPRTHRKCCRPGFRLQRNRSLSSLTIK